MLLNKAAIKAKVMQQMEGQVDRLLAEVEGKDELHLTQIEDLALQVQAEMGQVLTEALTQTQTVPAAEGASCPGCGRQMGYKGLKGRYLRTRSGEIHINRAYYYCPACRRGHFPPG